MSPNPSTCSPRCHGCWGWETSVTWSMTKSTLEDWRMSLSLTSAQNVTFCWLFSFLAFFLFLHFRHLDSRKIVIVSLDCHKKYRKLGGLEIDFLQFWRLRNLESRGQSIRCPTRALSLVADGCLPSVLPWWKELAWALSCSYQGAKPIREGTTSTT